MSDKIEPSLTTVRAATEADTPSIVQFIEELAEYEKLRDTCRADPARLREHLFGDRSYAEVLMAEHDGQPAGFALFFHTYSTFLCAPSLYLEDLFVRPAFRGRGIGEKLLGHLASLAIERGCRRMEWAVLDWNQPAIDFYLRVGARPMNEWTTFRLDGDDLAKLGRSTPTGR